MAETQRHRAPEKILLATDLLPACDRAFDRAVLLAKAWGSELTVMHVVATGEREVIGVARRESIADAEIKALVAPHRAEKGFKIAHYLTFGEPAERLIEIARETGAGLIVTGVAQAKSLRE